MHCISSLSLNLHFGTLNPFEPSNLQLGLHFFPFPNTAHKQIYSVTRIKTTQINPSQKQSKKNRTNEQQTTAPPLASSPKQKRINFPHFSRKFSLLCFPFFVPLLQANRIKQQEQQQQQQLAIVSTFFLHEKTFFYSNCSKHTSPFALSTLV